MSCYWCIQVPMSSNRRLKWAGFGHVCEWYVLPGSPSDRWKSSQLPVQPIWFIGSALRRLNMNNATGILGCRFLPRPSGASPFSNSTMSTTFNAILHHILIYYEQMQLELLWSTRPSHGEGSWAEFAHFTAMLVTPTYRLKYTKRYCRRPLMWTG
jgi:hypothetical protein